MNDYEIDLGISMVDTLESVKGELLRNMFSNSIKSQYCMSKQVTPQEIEKNRIEELEKKAKEEDFTNLKKCIKENELMIPFDMKMTYPAFRSKSKPKFLEQTKKKYPEFWV